MPATQPADAPAPYQRLYVNIDHVATLRQARRGAEPDPVEAALLCEQAGADGITAHLREDRRHVQHDDVRRLAARITTVLNLELACTAEMLDIAIALAPHQATLVPERREEVTTEGGLDVAARPRELAEGLRRLGDAGIRTSLFIDPEPDAVRRARDLGAVAIELHTGRYAHCPDDPVTLAALRDAAALGASLGLAVHAGHGLTVRNVAPVAAIREVEELNIGHSVVSRALFVGLTEAVGELRRAMDGGRAAVSDAR
ncbi:MAG TPA: pyridoxine 5'-phosphate synthase [Gemmatimonadaceae bacterium]|nr:pyridoxine 5'-phosphate synthase [Gemmatimonadaceae bacterium]